MQRAPISALEADGMTFLMIFALTHNKAVDELFVFVAHEVEFAGATSSFGCNKVCSIAVDVEDHVAHTIERGW